MPSSKKEFGPGYYYVFIAAGLLLLFIVFSRLGVSPPDYLKFLCGMLLLVYLPGRMLLGFSTLKLPRLETVSLSLVLGMVTTTAVNKFSRWFGLEFIFYLWVILALAFFIWRLIKNPSRKENPVFRLTPVGTGVLVLLLLVVGVLLIDNYRNVIPGEDGSLIVNMHYYDGFYRNAISRELSHTVPPMVPAVGDLSLSYHYGMDLFVSLFYRYLGLNVYDLNHRFIITFFFILLVLIFFLFIRELTRSDKAALLGTFLLIFGSGGFAYLASWILGIRQWGNIFFTFYFFNITNINSFLPGLSILFAGFFCLFRYLKDQKPAWMVFAGLLLALSLEFKTFFIGPVVGALFLAGIIHFVVTRKLSILKVWGITTALALPLLYAARFHNVGGLPYVFKFKFVDWINFSLQDINLDYLYLTWKGVIQHGSFSVANVALVVLCLLIFFIGAFGLGVVALPSVLKEYFSFKKIRPERMFLITFFGGSLLYFFTIQLLLDGRPRTYVHIYAFFLAFIVLTIFWAEKVIRFAENKGKVFMTGVILIAVALSVPNTLQFLRVKVGAPQPRIFPAPFLEVADWVNNNTEPESMILQPTQLRYVCYFADRRVVMDNSAHSYLDFHLNPAQIKRRTADIDRFFKYPELSADVLERYGVAYVWAGNPPFDEAGQEGEQVERNPKDTILCFSDLGTQGIKKYQKSHRLKPLFANSDYMIYQVQKLHKSEQEIFVLEEEEGGKRTLRPFQEVVKYP